MREKISNRTKKVVNHVHRHRGKYAAAVTAAAFMKLSAKTAREFDAFLESKGIDPDEFWFIEE